MSDTIGGTPEVVLCTMTQDRRPATTLTAEQPEAFLLAASQETEPRDGCARALFDFVNGTTAAHAAQPLRAGDVPLPQTLSWLYMGPLAAARGYPHSSQPYLALVPGYHEAVAALASPAQRSLTATGAWAQIGTRALPTLTKMPWLRRHGTVTVSRAPCLSTLLKCGGPKEDPCAGCRESAPEEGHARF